MRQVVVAGEPSQERGEDELGRTSSAPRVDPQHLARDRPRIDPRADCASVGAIDREAPAGRRSSRVISRATPGKPWYRAWSSR